MQILLKKQINKLISASYRTNANSPMEKPSSDKLLLTQTKTEEMRNSQKATIKPSFALSLKRDSAGRDLTANMRMEPVS